MQKPKNKCLWFLGLSGSGKTTLGNDLLIMLKSKSYKVVLLDGDLLRMGLNSDLGFSDKDRIENVRRTAEVARLFLLQDYWVIVALITPFESMRKSNQITLGDQYIEIYVDTPLAVCKMRDPKGHYAKAAKMELLEFTGIDSRFDVPENPNLIIQTDRPVHECSFTILNYLHTS